MASSRQPWPPYPFATTRDCSLGICSSYCFQNCYFFFPPPPSSSSSSSGSPTLSPLLIAIIAVLATAFLLVAYYTILSKYRRRFQGLNASRPSPSAAAEADAAWQAAPRDGLDESLINRIAVHKYRAGDGLAAAGSTDCSVCLAEFRDGESLRLLPKCGHAFHLPCIDTWLKSHSSCPLCRACIVPPATSAREPTTALRQLLDDGQAGVTAAEESESASAAEVGSGGAGQEEEEEEANCSGIEIAEAGARAMRRSLSMDSSFLRAAADSIAETGSSRWSRALSFSGGRPSSGRNGRGRSAILPI